MVGRKPSVDPLRIINAVLHYKNSVIEENGSEKKIVVASNNVWSDISNRLGGSISKNALYIFVQQGRHGIHEKLGIGIANKRLESDHNVQCVEPIDEFDESSDSSGDNVENLPTKKFTITLSTDEWKQIKPNEVLYKNKNSFRSYLVLPKGSWTNILAEHIWMHTNLPCCIAFRRAKVTDEGNHFIVVDGRCSICYSYFKGIIFERPSENSRVLMECTYTGQFDDPHKIIKKRRLTEKAKMNVISAIVNDGKSSETYREFEAVRLMKSGNIEPAVIPSGGALRTLKWRYKSGQLRNKDTLTALALMREEDEYKNVLQDMGCFPFFLYYQSSEQIHIYREYCRNCPRPKIIIDATGSVISNFKKFGTEKTKSLFLYEILVYDATKKHSFTASNMISERHTNIAISNWFARWLSCNIPPPKESVCDQSLALLSAIVKCFTQYSSLQEYLNVCADLTLNQLDSDSRWLPQCFVRTDVAHFIKMISRWPPLKTTPRRVKEIVLRLFGLLVKNQSIEEIYSLVFSMFVVFNSETDGNDIEMGHETPCERHKKKLIEATSSGFINYEEEFNEIILIAENEDDARVLLEEEYERQYEGLDNLINPFKSWADEILKRSQLLIREGSGINAMYIPTLIPHIIKCLKLLPLWSGIMVPFFGFGDETTSSAAVESSFKKLKTLTFKDISLPTNIETFLERHIISLRGTSLLRSSNQNVPLDLQLQINNNDQIQNEDQHTECNDQRITENIELQINNTDQIQNEDQHTECNDRIREDIELQIDNASSIQTDNLNEEDIAVESWNRKSKKQRTTKSYLEINPHLRHLNINTSKNIMSLPLLKNGSRAEELKSCVVQRIGKVIMSNTCAFDTVTSIIMVAYCDSVKYSQELNNFLESNKYFSFISKIVKQGITSSTYSDRASIMISELQPTMEVIEYETVLAVCNTTIGYIIKHLFKDLPSALDSIKCTNPKCKKTTLTPIAIPYINIQITNGDLSSLQQDIDSRLTTRTSLCGYTEKNSTPCTGNKTVTSTTTKMHVFIELLNWIDENEINSNQYSAEAAPHPKIKLSNIPPVLIINDKAFELRGVFCYRQGLSRLRNSVGHYYAYGKRGPNNWEIFDDIRKKSKPIKNSIVAPCEYLVYTI